MKGGKEGRKEERKEGRREGEQRKKGMGCDTSSGGQYRKSPRFAFNVSRFIHFFELQVLVTGGGIMGKGSQGVYLDADATSVSRSYDGRSETSPVLKSL